MTGEAALVDQVARRLHEHLLTDADAPPAFIRIDQPWDDPPAGGVDDDLVDPVDDEGPGTRLLRADLGHLDDDQRSVTLAQLAGLLGVEGLGALLPDQVTAFADPRLDLLQVDERTGAVDIEVSWAGATLPVIPGLVEVKDPGLHLALDAIPVDADASVSLFGTATIDGVDVDVAVELPGMGFAAALSEPQPLAPLLDFVGLDGSAFGDLTVDTLRVSGSPGELLAFDMILTDVWSPGPALVLRQVEVHVATQLGGGHATSGEVSAHGRLAGHGGHPGFDVHLIGRHDGPGQGWMLTAVLADETPLEIGALLTDLVGRGHVPAPLAGLDLHDIELRYATRSGDLTLAGTVVLDDTTTPPQQLALTVEILKDPDSTTDGNTRTRFSGALTLAGMRFDVVFASDPEHPLMLARFHQAGGTHLDLASLVEAVGGGGPSPLGDAHPMLTLNDVVLVREPARPPRPSKYLLAADIGLGVDLAGLSDLPLIGAMLPADQALRLTFQPLLTSHDPSRRPRGTPSRALDAEELAAIAALLPPGAPHLPDAAQLRGITASGFGLIATLRVGGDTRLISLGGADPQPSSRTGPTAPVTQRVLDPAGAEAAAAARQGTPLPDPHTALAKPRTAIHWIDLQTALGPIHLSRLGLGLDGGPGAARLDASLTAGPLTLSLEGLGATYDLTTQELGFSLDGLGLDLDQDAVAFSGLFLRDGDAFTGKATLRTEALTIGAIGAYQDLDGHPSFFLHAFLDRPLGGPAFFFVEGLALGFGYNRRLDVPPVAELRSFPLVTEAMGGPADPNASSPADVARAELASLARHIPADVGQTFLAVGVKFNSFQVLDGFALLIVSFGDQTEIDLIGEVTARLPQDDGTGHTGPALAFVTLMFAARYLPDEGYLGAAALIAPGSYVYTPDCHLSGGFALASWFSGPHDGDFVFTMGGYHPAFVVPAHLPQPAAVPRLALRWRVSDELSLHGELYFALTPAAAMAGGAQAVVWESGPLRAWFDLALDVLIQWQPYHYEATAHVEIGASLTIDPPIIGTIRVTIEAGAELELWGPEFSGRAHVHTSVLGVSVGFSVSFIDTRQGEPPPLDWPAFAAAFLPATAEIATIVVSSGLQRHLTDEHGTEWSVVDPATLVLTTDSALPTTALRTASPHLAAEHRPMQAFGVAPMHAAAASSVTAIDVHRAGHPGDHAADFALVPSAKAYPAAMWGTEHDPHRLLNAGPVIATGGCLLRPSAPTRPGRTARIERRQLDCDVIPRGLPWEPSAQLPVTDAALADPPTEPNPPGTSADGARRRLLTSALAANAERRRAALAVLGFDADGDVVLGGDVVDTFVRSPRVVVAGLPLEGVA